MKISSWKPPLKPREITESRLIRAILDGTFPINSNLPGERELSALLGVTRPTLREVMQRLERDGWFEVRHGKPTRVRDYLNEGHLGVSIALAKYQNPFSTDFVGDLLEIRILLAPTYTKIAVEKAPDKIFAFLQNSRQLSDAPDKFSHFDWQLHWLLSVCSENVVFTHLINSMQRLYEITGALYFEFQETRQHSRQFYRLLSNCTASKNGTKAGALALHVMSESASFWKELVRTHTFEHNKSKNEIGE